MLQEIYVVYFSPTGGTLKAAMLLANGMAERVHQIDLSGSEAEKRAFSEKDTVICAVPVFGGRVPSFAEKRINSLKGNGAKVVAVVVYGNRDYDDALLELSELLKGKDFRILAGAALIAEHSIVRKVAAGRPDIKDEAEIQEYGLKLLDKLQQSGEETAQETGTMSIPGNIPYRPYSPIPIVPAPDETCIACGICAEQCYTAAINKEAVQDVEAALCMSCMHCISVCPIGARIIPETLSKGLSQKLEPLEKIKRENELII